MLKSSVRLDPDDFLPIFKFSNTETYCKNTNFHDSQAEKSLKHIPRI